MPEKKPLTDLEVYDRLHAALEALGDTKGETIHADTALATAKKSVRMIQFALLRIIERDPSTPQQPD